MELTPSGPIHPIGREGAMFCTNCGNELKPGMRFCTRCGAPVAHPASEPTAAPSVAQGALLLHADSGDTATDREPAASIRTGGDAPDQPGTAPHPPTSPATAQASRSPRIAPRSSTPARDRTTPRPSSTPPRTACASTARAASPWPTSARTSRRAPMCSTSSTRRHPTTPGASKPRKHPNSCPSSTSRTIRTRMPKSSSPPIPMQARRRPNRPPTSCTGGNAGNTSLDTANPHGRHPVPWGRTC